MFIITVYRSIWRTTAGRVPLVAARFREAGPRRSGDAGPSRSGEAGLSRSSAVAMICLPVLLVGVSYGAGAVGAGTPAWLPVLLSLLVLAGSSEMLFVAIVVAGGNPIAAAAAGLLVNARHLPYGLALPPGITGPGRFRRLLGAHVLNDESVSFALAGAGPSAAGSAGDVGWVRRRAAFWSCGLGILICWPAGAALGAMLGSVVRDTRALGLDAMFPAIILALVLPGLRDRAVRRAAITGMVIAVLTTPVLPPGLPLLLSLAGLAAAGYRREPGVPAASGIRRVARFCRVAGTGGAR